MIKTFKKTAEKQLTKHFRLSEIHCHGKKCCNKTKLDTAVVKLAEKMRVALGVAFTVESGFRCDEHNRAVGGANGSGHCKGTALDLTTENVSRERLAVLAELVGVPRIGIYKTDNKKCMIHIGTGNKCHWINTGNYLATSHSFLGGEWAKPTGKVSANSKRKHIRFVQGWLFAKGFYSGDIDGDWGKKTQVAVDKFRKANGWKKANYLKSKGIKVLSK